MKLTAKSTAGLKLPTGKIDHLEFDDAIPGFALRLREGGSRTWVYQYKLGSKQRRMVIGRAAAIPADKAREIAAQHHALVCLGRDPQAEKGLSKVRATNSFGDLVRRYLEFQKDGLRPRSLEEVTRHLEVHAKPLHALPVTSIDRRAIADRLDRLAEERGAVTSNRVRSSLSALFSWAMQRGLSDLNPVANTGKREEKPRDRILTDHEMAIIWRELKNDDFGRILQLLILTAARRNEIGNLRWSEVDFDRGLVVLPAERVKNGFAHELPMSGAVNPGRAAGAGRPRSGLWGA
jgi:Arm domain-containing DNA-binding protein/integrase-like protein